MPLSVGMPIYRPGITDIALWRDCIGGLLRNNVLSDRLCSVRLISKDIAMLTWLSKETAWTESWSLPELSMKASGLPKPSTKV